EQVPPEDDRGEPCPALRAPGGQARIGQRGQAAVPLGPVRRGGGGAGHGSSLGSPPGRTLGRGGGCDRRRTACRPGAQLSVQRNPRTPASTPATAQARSTCAPWRVLGRGGGGDRRRTACRPGARLSVQRNPRTTASTPATAQARSTCAEPGEKVPEARQARCSSPWAPEGSSSTRPRRIRG